MELMVGLTLGLIVLAGGAAWSGLQLGEHARLVQELQVQQELRAVVDMIERDLRRAGAHGRPQDLVWAPERPSPPPNLQTAIDVSAPSQRINYSFSRDDLPGAEPALSSIASPGSGPSGSPMPSPAPPSGNELSSVRWTEGDWRLDQLTGLRFQPLTDPLRLRIDGFHATLSTKALNAGGDDDTAQAPPSAATGATTRLVGDCSNALEVRTVHLRFIARSVHDPDVRHPVDLIARLRNDQVVGSCP